MIVYLLMLAATQSATPGTCGLTPQDKAANAKLSWDDFDQKGTLPSTGRKLMERGCFEAAADAWADYMINGPVAAPNETRVMLWHLGQSLASAGDEKGAARVMAATRRADPSPPQTGPLKWNEYVIGTWAFLIKDRALLDRMRDSVLAGAGPGNRMNGNVLASMARCFHRPYAQVFEAPCKVEDK